MSSLANDLLNDFGDSGSEEDIKQEDAQNFHDESDNEDDKMDIGDGDTAVEEDEANLKAHDDEEDAKVKVEKMKLKGVSDVRSVAGLMETLQPVLEVSHVLSIPRRNENKSCLQLHDTALTCADYFQKIKHYQNLPPNERSLYGGSIEENPEYKLLTQSNSLSTQIDGEIVLVHKFIRDHYSAKFPELENLVTNPIDYAKTVAILGNEPLTNVKSLAETKDNLVGATLRSVLDGPTLMIVHLEGTTTKGVDMSEKEIQVTLRACQMIFELEKAKKTLIEYVQSRMTAFAPNLTALAGSLLAAQLLNQAGGVTGLARTPACNIASYGTKNTRSAAGFATNVGIRQQGFLYHSPILQGVPEDQKRQAMRIVSSKIVLAVRSDLQHVSMDGSAGDTLREEIFTRLEKLAEPPENRGIRALPAPDDKPSRKRGGRRARKAKETNAMTDLRKAQNRMAFGKEEKEVGFGGETKGLGMIGQENDGRVRAGQIDQRTRARLSKKNPGWGGGSGTSGFASSLNNGMNTSLKSFGAGSGNATTLRASGLRTSGVGGGSATAGTASSIAFTPVQGLELIDPKMVAERKRKAEAAEAAGGGYFSSGTFTQVNSGKVDGQGFKVPTLPAVKRLKEG